MSSKRVLVLDEDAPRRRLNAFGLRCAGFTVDEASDASSAWSQIVQRCPHLVLIITALLDFGIQDFVRTLRGDPCTRDLPVVTLVERESEFDAVAALEWGIDDYLREPISPEAFVARVRSGVERNVPAAPVARQVAGLRLDADRGVLHRGTRAVALGPTERRLLELFLAHPDQIIPRDLLLFRIWGGGANLHSRVLDVSVCRLRRVLRQLGYADLLRTVSRHGYRLVTGAEESLVRDASRAVCNQDVTFGV
jgi:DNA-binding response OmpR family regulator